MALVTLTTDFGTRDAYVAAMKGVLWTWCPGVHLVDLTHEIAPQDTIEAALFLARAVPYFPRSSIHLVVVDPGVGTDRLPLVVYADGKYFVGPDNGVLAPVLRDCEPYEARKIENPRFMAAQISATFHGRDVFAPAAACLARGEAFADFGGRVFDINLLNMPRPAAGEKGTLHGKVVHVDRFGNLITNICRRDVADKSIERVDIGTLSLEGVHETYGEVPRGEALALFGGTGYLEIAIRKGNAAESLGFERGEDVAIRPATDV